MVLFAFTNSDCRVSILARWWIILISLLFRSQLAAAGSVFSEGLAYYIERVVRLGLGKLRVGQELLL